jgi:peptide/nickel transport system substrate-binding protein
MRRHALLFGSLLAIGACGDGEQRALGTGGGHLVVGTGQDVSPSGAFQARLGVYPLNVNVAETLTRLTPDYRVEPLLATRWEYRGENTWRFHLRPGVTFHDGQPLDARAVGESLEQVVAGGLGYSFMADRPVTVIDDLTLDIRTTRPNLRLPEELVHPNYGIFSPGSDPARHPVGTGPFRWVEYRPHERIVVERFDGFRGDPPRLDRITFRFYPDPNTRVLALLAGEVDLITDLPREQVDAVESRSGFRVARAPVGQMLNLHVNANGRAPHDLLRDRELRRGIALALDRAPLVETLWSGEGETVQNMTVPAVLGTFAELVRGFSHDPQAAHAALDAAGWRAMPNGSRERDGRHLRLEMLAHPEIEPATAEFVQDQLRRAGMEVRWSRIPDTGSYAERLNAGEFDLNLAVPNQNDANPLFLPALIFYSGSARPFARWHHVNERFDRLVEQGLRVESTSQAQRYAAEAIRIAQDEEAIVISLAGRYRIHGMRDDVAGFDAHPSATNQSWVGVHRVER